MSKALSKEKFISPKVLRTVRVELGNDLLVGSPDSDVETSIVSLGHEIDGEYTINNSYWE